MTNDHTVLSIAPMCNYPPIDGASTRIIAVATALSSVGITSTIIGSDFVLTLPPGQQAQISRFTVRGWRYKRQAAAFALCTAGHYPEIKFYNPAWEHVVHDYVQAHRPSILIANYLWTMPTVSQLPVKPDLIVYDTHNSEWQMYDTCIQESHNPLKRWIWRNAITRYDTLAMALPSDTVLMHISAADLADHHLRRPDLQHILVPLCARLAVARIRRPDYTMVPKRLLFCGSLSGMAGVDALTYFAQDFWPTVQAVSQVVVAGSNPNKQVQRLCQAHSWRLEANFDSQRKAELYEEAHFAILPFKHGSGSKLKLIEACSYGVPVLTTIAGNSGGLHLPSSAVVSDNAADWYRAIQSTTSLVHCDSAIRAFCDEYAPARTIRPLLALFNNRMCNI